MFSFDSSFYLLKIGNREEKVGRDKQPEETFESEGGSFVAKIMGAIWIPANTGVVDETLVPHKGRKNPHHVFIMRNPHPHGIKNWSLVDFSGYFVAFSQYH